VQKIAFNRMEIQADRDFRKISAKLAAATNIHCPKLSGVGGGPAVNGAVGGALATGSGGLGFGGDSFAIFESSLFGF
jgi:hypothetical protein